MIFIQIRKVRESTLFSQHIICTIGVVFHKSLTKFLSVNVNFCHFGLSNSKYLCIAYPLRPIFSTSFCKYLKWGSRKKLVFLTTCQGNVRE